VSKASSSDKAGILTLIKYRIQVTSTDIEQLEKMSCNYKSVSQKSGKRGLKYKVGDFFNFTAHQFRHTFAWFIIANQLGDLDDTKYQFKHLNRVMTFVCSERGYESLNWKANNSPIIK
jgi:integrase